jgi:hypothetical protein
LFSPPPDIALVEGQDVTIFPSGMTGYMYIYETATIIFIVGTIFFLLAFKVEFAKSLKF